MLPHGSIAGSGDVIGLGSANPKGMITALTEAVRCIRSAGVPLTGDVLLAFAGGGMPSMPPQGEIRQNHGLSSGVTYMLNHGVTADFAIICKPGWAAAWEEVGLCWFKVTVRGQMGYAGMTRSFPNFRNAIVHAATFILALEEWLPRYQERNTSGLCSPQGAIAAVRGGWPHKPAFPTAATEVYIDLRCNPRTSPAAVKAQFAEAIAEICAQHPELTLDWDMYAACVLWGFRGVRVTPCRHPHSTHRLSARTDDSSGVAGFWRARCQPYSKSRESDARHSLRHH
jgi:acetylornithine deacetylase/succinyl-diaminopimelate desuccinylase-like protein